MCPRRALPVIVMIVPMIMVIMRVMVMMIVVMIMSMRVIVRMIVVFDPGFAFTAPTDGTH